MEHEIVGQAVEAAVDGALAGAVGKKKEPMTGKKTLKAMEQVMNAIFFVCGMVAVAFVLLISIYLIISGLPAIIEIGPINFLFGTRWYASTGDFGILAIILTSFAGTAGAILMGVPIGLHDGRLPVQGGAAQVRRRGPHGGGAAGGHPLGGVWPGGHDPAGARHPGGL